MVLGPCHWPHPDHLEGEEKQKVVGENPLLSTWTWPGEGELTMEGLVPISVLQSVPVGSRDAARVLKKLHLFSAGQQKGTEFRQRYKW